jgi:hypothetical protein
MSVPLGILSPVAEMVVAKADAYAADIVSSLPAASAMSPEALTECISGALLSFLSDVLRETT